MRQKLHAFLKIVEQDPAVDNVSGFTGGGTLNSASMWMQLKPLSQRKVSADQVINRLRGKLARIPGATLYLMAGQDIRVGCATATRNINSPQNPKTPKPLNYYS